MEVDSVSSESGILIRREIERFLEAAQQRSESEPVQRRRAMRRYHRSWPLIVSYDSIELSVALHNASSLGIAFLSMRSIPEETTVFLKLFCHEDFGLRVPAVVRHMTPTEHGCLIGCEFNLCDQIICEQALEHGRQRVVCE